MIQCGAEKRLSAACSGLNVAASPSQFSVFCACCVIGADGSLYHGWVDVPPNLIWITLDCKDWVDVHVHVHVLTPFIRCRSAWRLKPQSTEALSLTSDDPEQSQSLAHWITATTFGDSERGPGPMSRLRETTLYCTCTRTDPGSCMYLPTYFVFAALGALGRLRTVCEAVQFTLMSWLT